jgi:dihydroxyacetone kinase DhaKLM complex PTS-EIIA-like component DhaM
MNLRDLISEIADQMEYSLILLDGFDDALLGTSMINSEQMVAAYDYQTCIEILMRDHNMDHETALDYFNFNIAGIVTQGAPIFLTRYEV